MNSRRFIGLPQGQDRQLTIAGQARASQQVQAHSCPLWVESKHFAAREPCPLYPQKRTGIQVSDVVLRLYSQFQKNKPLPPKCVAIVDYVRAHGWENNLSFAGVERSFIQK